MRLHGFALMTVVVLATARPKAGGLLDPDEAGWFCGAAGVRQLVVGRRRRRQLFQARISAFPVCFNDLSPINRFW